MAEFSSVLNALLYIVPAIVVLITAYMLIRRFLDNDYRLRLLQAKSAIQKDVLPLRLQAYERLVLLLERITPSNLVLRISKPGLKAKDLHGMLVQAVRDEYEHNLSQQVYVSSQAWMMVKNAKEDVLRMINTAGEHVDSDASGMELSKVLFDIMLRNEKMMTLRAQEFIKQEIRELF